MKNDVGKQNERWVDAKNIGAAILIAIGVGSSASVAKASPLMPDRQSAAFSLCGESRRVNCVVDGDTFWFQRRKIRIADIDAPELSPPRCEAERAKGEAAKQRLLALLNAGTFSLASNGSDQDRYGRELRIVTRKGRSVGATLVEEGLAHRWHGGRRSWCG